MIRIKSINYEWASMFADSLDEIKFLYEIKVEFTWGALEGKIAIPVDDDTKITEKFIKDEIRKYLKVKVEEGIYIDEV